MGRRSKNSRKGAFDISLGFIIIVIFAVILLTLSITWLRQFMTPLGTLTDDLTQDANNALRETFQKTTSSFAIYPSRHVLERGRALKMGAGIKNNAPDSQAHTYVINVIPTSVSNSVKTNIPGCSGNTPLTTCQLNGQSLYSEMLSWVTWNSTELKIPANEFVVLGVTITPGNSSPTGLYQYLFVACRTDGTNTTQASCLVKTQNWGSPMPLEIELE
jgi:hypothetical protein